MLFTDLNEVKEALEIDPGDRSEDVQLTFLVTQASNWIEEVLDRPGMSFASRTEYYGGTNTSKLLLRSRPVYATPEIAVRVDQGGYFGSASGSFGSETALTYGTDFALRIDLPGDKSRSGILYRIGGVWEKQFYRSVGLLSPYLGESPGSIRVTYSGGYTVADLPPVFRFACNLLVSRMRYVLPLGMEIGSEGYEERSIGLVTERKDYLLSLVKPLILPYRNWSF